MHMQFSESRMLAQRSPDARGPELPSSNDLRAMMSRIETGVSDMVRSALSPENRRQFNQIVESFGKEFNQVKDQFMSEIRREIPNIRSYLRLGGTYGPRAGRYEYDRAGQTLRDLERRPATPYRLPVEGDGFASVAVGGEDGTDFLELYGDGDASMFEGDAGFSIDTSGMVALLNEARTINQRLNTDRTRVLNESLAKLAALRTDVERDESAVTPARTETPVSTATPRTETAAEPGVTVDPATGERRVGNVPLRPGETPDQLRARLNEELASAQKAFNEQRDLVRKLVAESASEERIKPERDKLRELQLALTAVEGQIKGLEGLAQPDRT